MIDHYLNYLLTKVAIYEHEYIILDLRLWYTSCFLQYMWVYYKSYTAVMAELNSRAEILSPLFPRYYGVTNAPISFPFSF